MSICFYKRIIFIFFRLISLLIRFLFFISSYSLFVEYCFFSNNSIGLIFLLLLDWISLCFMGVVLLISSVVLIYIYSYIGSDKNIYKFVIIIYLFILSILLVILSPNILRILLGWDGLGLVSYCLVIYYQNIKSCNAGILTVLSNRLGDIAILISICWILNFGSCNFFYLQYIYNDYSLLIVFFLVLIASITKSAQIPFSAWLPAAIAAPTPVSSLVHSSTLVTAGVYLIIRFHNVLEYNYILFIISCATIFISGLGANFECDLKKVIALSTLSQLGVIIIILSIGQLELAFFHLLAHALFKSLLFLCAGFYIHSSSDIQDFRISGAVTLSSPIVSTFFFCSSISLCGFPFISGFYSKDLILEMAFINNLNLFFMLVLIRSTVLTLLYSLRLFSSLSLHGYHFSISSITDDPMMYFPITLLFLLSLTGGCLLSWCFFPCYYSYICMSLKLITITLLLLSIFLYFALKKKLVLITTSNHFIYFFSLIWNMPLIFTHLRRKALQNGLSYIKLFDQGWLELVGGQGGFTIISIINSSLHIIINSFIKSLFLFSLFVFIFMLTL
jgi:NADH-ubiquinone oxidoreductase chain 5